MSEEGTNTGASAYTCTVEPVVASKKQTQKEENLQIASFQHCVCCRLIELFALSCVCFWSVLIATSPFILFVCFFQIWAQGICIYIP